MRPTLLLTACALVCLSLLCAHAAQDPQPASSRPPKPGVECKPGQPYTLGSGSSAFDLTLVAAEYRATRVKVGKANTWPDAEQKLLVLHFTVHNPSSSNLRFSKNLKWTAVTAGGQNSETTDAYTKAAPNDTIYQDLQPDQTVALYSVLQVPAAGPVDMLTATNNLDRSSPPAMYSLQGLAKRIEPPYADASDPSGATPTATVQGRMGQTYEIGDYDVAVLGLTTTTETIPAVDAFPPGKDKAYAFVTFRVTNRSSEGHRIVSFEAGWCDTALRDSEGGKYTPNNSAFRTSAYAAFDPSPEYGETVTFRKSYYVDRGAALDSIRLKDHGSHEVIVKLGAPGTVVEPSEHPQPLQPPTLPAQPAGSTQPTQPDQQPAARGTTTKTYPFEVTPGGRATFGIPLTSAGDIRASATWSGAPLVVTLVDEAGRKLAGQDGAVRGSASLAQSAAADPGKKQSVWLVVVSDPGGTGDPKVRRPPVATGQITLQYPTPDPVRLQALDVQQKARKAATLKDLADRRAGRMAGGGGAVARAASVEDTIKTRMQQIQQQDAAAFRAAIDKLKGRLDAARQGVTRSNPAGSIPSGTAPQGPGVPGDRGQLPVGEKVDLTPPPAPEVVSVSPADFWGGDDITVTVRKASGDPKYTSILLVSGALAAEIQSSTKVDDTVVLKARVPDNPPTVQTFGPTSLVVRSISPSNWRLTADSKPQYVYYHTRSTGTLDSLYPQALEPGVQLGLTGRGFRAGTDVHIAFPDGHELVVPKVATDGMHINVAVPNYVSTASYPVVVYVQDIVHNKPVASNVLPANCLATMPALNSVREIRHEYDTYQEDAFRSIEAKLMGTGLKRIETVTFVPDPGQEGKIFTQIGAANDCRTPWKSVCNQDTELYAFAPGGCTGLSAPVSGKLVCAYTKPTPGSLTAPFTLRPFIVTQRIFDPVYTAGTAFAKKNGGDKYEIIETDFTRGNQYDRAWLHGEHNSDFPFLGHAGDDIMVMDAPLKNGWTLESTAEPFPGEQPGFGARVEGCWTDDAGRPTCKVHWWVDADNTITMYDFWVIIKGPRGVPYK